MAKLKWNVRAVMVSNPSGEATEPKFSSTQCADEQESHHIESINPADK